MRILFVYTALILGCTIAVAQQQDKVSWSAGMEQTIQFIENKGQFDERCELKDANILYGIDKGPLQIFFRKDGVSYRFDTKKRNPDRREGDKHTPKFIYTRDQVHMYWQNTNPTVEVVATGSGSDYFVYSLNTGQPGKYYEINGIKGYQKITYKNLYPGIDVEYTIHPEGGIKYDLIVQPGADLSKVHMRYANREGVYIDETGKLHVPTKVGDLIEHAPVSFYDQVDGTPVHSEFNIAGNKIGFSADADAHRKLIVDPWVQTPNIPNANCAWECEVDGAGNVYIIGGDSPMRLLKYNSTGALQWTHNTPWDTLNDWLGAFATDQAGNSYVSNGSVAALQKVNTAGSVVWTQNGGPFDEYWSISFNCDETKLVVGGTRTGLLPPAGSHGVIFDINTNNGQMTNMINVASLRPGPIISDINEVRSITSSRNAKYYFLTLDTIGAINQNITTCSNEPLFAINSGYDFAYKSEFYRPKNGNAGICALTANDQFVYSQNGVTVQQRSPVTGAIINSVAIPGGINTTTLGLNQPGNNGLAVDDCGNVYVGSGDRVLKYDANLNQLQSVNVPFKVYDVAVNNNGEVIVSGGTGNPNSPTRTGYVQSINMSACAPYPLICCDATICPDGPFCDTDPPVTLEPVTPGGTWSGPGITDANGGVFDPSVAGSGTHTIIYTLACGSDSTQITVNACAQLEVCEELNGDYTVSNGTAPYTWESGAPFTNCSGCPFNLCNPFCPGFPDTTWTSFGSGTTVTPTGTFPIRVTDNAGNSITYTSAAGIINCTTCPNITTNVSSQNNVTCNGGNNGSATVSASGGQGPYTYNWQPGNLSGATQNSLSATTYTIISTDANSCRDTITLTITQPGPFTASVNITNATCANANGSATAVPNGGTGPYTYTWSPGGQNTATINNLGQGTYTVTITDANSCTATASGTVSGTNGMQAFLSNPVDPTCAGSDGTVDFTFAGGASPFTITVDTGGTPIVINQPSSGTQTISGLPDGQVAVSVEDANGCIESDTLLLNAPNCCTFTVSAALTPPSCGQGNGEIVITPSNGSGNYSYTWAGGVGTGNTASNLTAGNYAVTITDNGFANCFIDTSFTLNSAGNLNLNLTNPVDPTCAGNDGEITVSLSGGTGPYTVTIDTGGTPIVVNIPIAFTQTFTGLPDGTVNVSVEDAQGCLANASATLNAPNCCTFTVAAALTDPTCGQSDGEIVLTTSNGSGNYSYTWAGGVGTGTTASNLGAGTYDVTITDNAYANCFIDTSFTLNSAGNLSVTLSNPVDPTCAGNDGSIDFTISGGTAPYTVTVDTGGTSIVINVPAAGTQTITGLDDVTANVTVEDAQGCIDNDGVTLNTPVCCTFGITAAITDPACGQTDGSIVITPSNGSGNYTYNWANGVGTGNTASNLAAGTYAVTITDNGFINCTIDTTFSLSNSGAPTISSVNITGVDCAGDSTGSIAVTATGGTAPYVYAWNNGQVTATATNLPGGSYTLAITDANNCVVTGSYIVPENAPLIVQMNAQTVDCADPNSGGASVSVTGGSGTYTYLWSNSATTDSITGVPTGQYDVVVTDALGCTATADITITSDSAITLNLGPNQTVCVNDTVVLTTGDPNTIWSTGDTAELTVFSGQTQVWATIANGNCVASDTVNFTLTPLPTTPVINVEGSNLCTGETLLLDVVDSGYLYYWSTGDTALQIVVSEPNLYEVTALNECGSNSAAVLIYDKDCDCVLYMPNVFTPNGDGLNDTYRPYTECYPVEEYLFQIFDRWGGLVFQSTDLLNAWDGTSKGRPANEGVYVYHLSYRHLNGADRRQKKLSGSVTLLR